MYLSQLEVVGFKSFAQKTKFKFNQGISAVVGPNGCGKTNVVDAIRWVLGEQKSAVLRSEVMDNVIFNGTKTRKPLGMAEASLVIQNNKGILPSDYSEVTITRRIFRDGESEYLINNTKCRLRDILDLFMDTGMGSDSYSVIELKMVEAILSGRPEERRHLIEEAAGVNKYKLRRREATRKLQNIQADLLRVHDIVAEVEKLVNSLARQASKTKRYNKLFERHKELEIALILIDFKNQRQLAERFEAEIKDVISKKIEQEKQLTENEELLKNLATQLNDVDLEYQDARDNESLINKEISQMTKDIAVAQERYLAIEKNQTRIEKDITETEVRSMTALENIESAKTRLDEYKTEQANNHETTELARTNRDEIYSLVKERRQKVNYANEDAINLQNSLNSIKNTLHKNRNRKDNLQGLLDRGYTDIDKVRSEMDGLAVRQSEAESMRDSLASNHNEAENELKTAIEQQNAYKNQIEILRNSISDRKNNLSAKKASLDYLNSLVDVDESAKFLLNNNNWQIDTEKTILIEAVGADESYRIAIEAALGSSAYSFLVDTPEVAQKAISSLSNANKGKASFICRNLIPTAAIPTINYTDDTKHRIYGIISEIVRVDDDIRNFLRILLDNTVIVETYTDAQSIINEGIASAAITLKGEIVRKSGLIRGGGVLKKEGQTVGKRERIQELKDEISGIKSEIEALELELKETKEDLDCIDIRLFTETVKSAESAISKNEQLINQLIYKAEALENNISAFEKNTARYEEELKTIEAEEENSQIESEEIESKLNIAKEELRALQAKVTNEEAELRKKEEELKLAEMNRIKIEAQISAAVSEIQRNENDINNTANRIEKLKNEITENEQALVRISETITQGELELKDLNVKFDEAKNQRELLAEKKANLDEQIEQYSNDLSQMRKMCDKTTEAQHQIELKINETKVNLKNLNERAAESFEVDLYSDEVQTIELESIPEAKAELADIKSKLSQLGNVNFMALEEFEAQSKRFTFYQEQLKDLTDSEKTLQETIAEINDTAEKKFRDTFDLVNANFQMLFKKLFNSEAESELKLTGDSILDCDIEIMAKPPGKKPHSIEMLSQGEKTLTAIALLFGIYLVKPSPFCILDEVDAPLDDMNIDRFLGMIKQFSIDTQFLMVTHNKKTMTAADTLYGVTMHEEGVSKVVSVKLAPNQEPILI